MRHWYCQHPELLPGDTLVHERKGQTERGEIIIALTTDYTAPRNTTQTRELEKKVRKGRNS